MFLGGNTQIFSTRFDSMTVSVDSSKNEAIIETWRRDYNEFRPHSALDNMTPEEYVKKYLKKARNL